MDSGSDDSPYFCRRGYMSRRYPIHLDISGRLCVVIGGGSVGERRAIGLLNTGATVRVVAPSVTTNLQARSEAGELEILLTPYSQKALEGAFLVVAATDSRAVNAQVTQDAKARSLLVNVADSPADGDFIVPSTLRRGDLEISVTTGGSLPALTQQITAELDQRFGDEYGAYVELMGEIRDYMKMSVPISERSVLARRVLAGEADICSLLREGNQREARELAFRLLEKE